MVEDGHAESREHTILPLRARRTDPDALGRFRRIVPLAAGEDILANEVRRAVDMNRQTEIGRVFVAVPILEIDTERTIAIIAAIER